METLLEMAETVQATAMGTMKRTEGNAVGMGIEMQCLVTGMMIGGGSRKVVGISEGNFMMENRSKPGSNGRKEEAAEALWVQRRDTGVLQTTHAGMRIHTRNLTGGTEA
jgi:hypothetical protein